MKSTLDSENKYIFNNICQEMEQFRVEFVNGILTIATCMPLKILGHFDCNIKKEIFEELE